MRVQVPGLVVALPVIAGLDQSSSYVTTVQSKAPLRNNISFCSLAARPPARVG